jgi:hypothetical protein
MENSITAPVPAIRHSDQAQDPVDLRELDDRAVAFAGTR